MGTHGHPGFLILRKSHYNVNINQCYLHNEFGYLAGKSALPFLLSVPLSLPASSLHRSGLVDLAVPVDPCPPYRYTGTPVVSIHIGDMTGL